MDFSFSQKIKSKLHQKTTTFSLLVASGMSHAESGGSKFSASSAKTAADNIFTSAWDQIVTGFNITSALVGGLVFIICVAVWIGAFMKVHEAGKGWGNFIALVLVGIVLILFTFWALGTGSDQISKGYK